MNVIRKYLNIATIALLLLPTMVSASGIKDLINALGGLIDTLIAILVALALAVFIWGLVKFIWRLGGDEEEVKEGKKLMVWGIVALFVMLSVWGIVIFMQEALLPNEVNSLEIV